MEEKKQLAYVVCSKTLKELQELVRNEDRYNTINVVEYNIDRSNISEEQKKIQRQNHWYTDCGVELRIREGQLYELAKELIHAKILSGCKNNIVKEVHDEIYNKKIRAVVAVKDNEDFDTSTLTAASELGCVNEYGEDNSKRYTYSDNLEEFKKKLEKTKSRNSFSVKDGEYVLLERFYVYVRPYTYEDMDKTITKQINKVIKNELTYCLKGGKVIIPEEYLEKGEQGIKEWREMKSSKNKNNSIEKRILRQTINEKKAYAFESMCKVMDAVTSSTFTEWSIPYITIDGRWNKQRTTKLVKKVIDTKDQQYYIDTSKEELVNKFKEYWKKVLMEAYNNVDQFVMEESDNA